MICRTCSNAAVVKGMAASDAGEFQALARTLKMPRVEEAEKTPATPAMVVRPIAPILLHLLQDLQSEVLRLMDNTLVQMLGTLTGRQVAPRHRV